MVGVFGLALCAVANAGCTAQTAEEQIAVLRKSLNCTGAKPTTCACKANGVAEVTCNKAQQDLWLKGTKKWTAATNKTKCIKVTPDKDKPWAKHDFHYPATYSNECAQSAMEPGSYHCTFIKGKESTHEFKIGVNYNASWQSESWCAKKFCWVDPCKCNKMDIGKSSWLAGYYSYSMCGAKDTYSAALCTDGATKTKCTAISGCKWVAKDNATSGASQVGIGMLALFLPFIAK